MKLSKAVAGYSCTQGAIFETLGLPFGGIRPTAALHQIILQAVTVSSENIPNLASEIE